MLRQLQLRAPMKAMQLKRSLTCNPKQLQPLVKSIKKEQHSKLLFNPGHYLSQLIAKMAPLKVQIRHSNNLPLGQSNVRLQLPSVIKEKLGATRQYSIYLNPLEQLQIEKSKMSPSNNHNLPMAYSDPLGSGKPPSSGSSSNSSSSSSSSSSGSSSSSSSSLALVPLEQPTQSDQSLKNVGNPKPQPQSKMPEQPVRKIPYYNPLRRRSNVDPARVQYIKDRFKERNLETDTNKPQGKKFVSRTTLHSGRLDKID